MKNWDFWYKFEEMSQQSIAKNDDDNDDDDGDGIRLKK
jgi:hypothetical protein